MRLKPACSLFGYAPLPDLQPTPPEWPLETRQRTFELGDGSSGSPADSHKSEYGMRNARHGWTGRAQVGLSDIALNQPDSHQLVNLAILIRRSPSGRSAARVVSPQRSGPA